jgi:hypothetical protein
LGIFQDAQGLFTGGTEVLLDVEGAADALLEGCVDVVVLGPEVGVLDCVGAVDECAGALDCTGVEWVAAGCVPVGWAVVD